MDNWLEKFQDIADWFKQRKTYIVGLVAAILLFLQQGLGIAIPTIVYTILGLLGLWTLKSGQNRIENGLNGKGK